MSSGPTPRARAVRKHGFPAKYRRLTPIEKSGWLGGDECKGLATCGALQKSQVEAEKRRLKKSASAVARKTPSPSWMEAYYHGDPFPPPAEHTPMIQSGITFTPQEREQYFPFYYVIGGNGGTLYDVAVYEDVRRKARIDGLSIGSSGTESPSARAIAEAVTSPVALVEMKMEPESEAALLEQIKRYNATKEMKV